MPATFDLYNPTVYQGDTYVMEMVFWDDEARTIPYNVDSAVGLKAEIRHHTASTVLGTFIVDLVASNQVRLTLTSTTTRQLPRNRNPLRWDFQVIWDSNTPPGVSTLVKGKVIVEGDITDSK